jgi:hypothetical protein
VRIRFVRKVKTDDLKEAMYSRLSAEPASLNLDIRFDEAPEDKFAALASSHHREDVVGALNVLMFETFSGIRGARKSPAKRFLERALRLCSLLDANECKPTLKLILLEGEKSSWGTSLVALQELAARGLSGMPKDETDLQFWLEIAERRTTAFPYALRAAIEIDMREGLRLFWSACLSGAVDDLVDWSTILDETSELYEDEQIAITLESTFYECQGTKDPYVYERFLRDRLQLPKFSRAAVRTFEQLPISYGAELRHAISENSISRIVARKHNRYIDTFRQEPVNVLVAPYFAQQQAYPFFAVYGAPEQKKDYVN